MTMKTRLSIVLAILGCLCLNAAPVLAADDAVQPKAVRPAHTFSIVARDAKTGYLGVAVQSHWFSVGTTVTWAEAGVGAVATQSFVEPAYGLRGLALMKSGLAAPDALKALLDVDPARDVRQVAFIDTAGRVDAHTGAKCIQCAGQHVGDGYSVQANMMLNDEVVPAMAKAYEAATGELADRLIAALEAGQAAGGDIRGRQAAAMLIVKGQSTGRPWADRVLELRVEDNPEPIVELRRLLTVHKAYEEMNLGDLAVEKNDMPGALMHYSAAAAILPDSLEIIYWQAVTLATNGRVNESLPLFSRIFSQDANWAELTRRLPAAGLIPDTPEGKALVEKILAVAPK
jgi:uncharacterized Ntn-hydrolase superfamily protein